MPFIFDLHEKITALMILFCQKKGHSLKNALLSHPYFSKIGTTTISKTQCSHVIFFQDFPWKSPCCHTHICSKKRKFCQNYTILWVLKKALGCPFFPIFHEKMDALMPKFCQQNVHSLKKDTAPMPIFCQKNVHSLKNTFSHVIFSNFSWKTPCWDAHIWTKNCQNYNKLWAKKVERMPLCFLFFTKKYQLSCLYFVKKNAH